MQVEKILFKLNNYFYFMIKRLNMKKSLFTLLMLASTASFANNVAVWNSHMAIANSNFAKAKVTATQNSIKPKQQQLKVYQENVERLQRQFDEKMSEQTQAELEKQIKANMLNYQEVVEQIQQSIDASEQEVMQKIAPKIQGITDNLIKQKNIDILLDYRNGNLTFSKKEWDITDDVTKAINEQVK